MCAREKIKEKKHDFEVRKRTFAPKILKNVHTSVYFYEKLGKNRIEAQNCRFLENLGICNYQNSKIVRKNIFPVIIQSILSKLWNWAGKKIP